MWGLILGVVVRVLDGEVLCCVGDGMMMCRWGW